MSTCPRQYTCPCLWGFGGRKDTTMNKKVEAKRKSLIRAERGAVDRAEWSDAERSGAEEKATRTDERDARSAPLGTNKRSLDQKPVGGRDGRMKTKAKKRTFRGGEDGGSNVLGYATSNRMGGHTVNQSSRARKAGSWFSRPLVCRASNQLRPKYAFCFETLFLFARCILSVCSESLRKKR